MPDLLFTVTSWHVINTSNPTLTPVTQTVTAQALSLPGSCWREFYTNPIMVCQSTSCVSNKAEFNFWLPVTIPDNAKVSEFYPQTRTYTQGGNNKEILDKVRLVLVTYQTFTAQRRVPQLWTFAGR